MKEVAGKELLNVSRDAMLTRGSLKISLFRFASRAQNGVYSLLISLVLTCLFVLPINHRQIWAPPPQIHPALTWQPNRGSAGAGGGKGTKERMAGVERLHLILAASRKSLSPSEMLVYLAKLTKKWAAQIRGRSQVPAPALTCCHWDSSPFPSSPLILLFAFGSYRTVAKFFSFFDPHPLLFFSLSLPLPASLPLHCCPRQTVVSASLPPVSFLPFFFQV